MIIVVSGLSQLKIANGDWTSLATQEHARPLWNPPVTVPALRAGLIGHL